MDSDNTSTEEGTLKRIITQRFPLILTAFFLASVYIYIGYAMQEMKLYEDNLRQKYAELRGTDVVMHTEMLKVTETASLESYIKKYRLNIILEKITPIQVSRDENSR